MGQKRVVIENVSPQINHGKFPVKRIVGEKVTVSADIFGDGHDIIFAELLWKGPKSKSWQRQAMENKGNDRWEAAFIPEKTGRYAYTIEAGVDHFATWKKTLIAKREAGQPLEVDLVFGTRILEKTIPLAASAKEAEKLRDASNALQAPDSNEAILAKILTHELDRIVRKNQPAQFITRFEKELQVAVTRKKALFSAWYELFPRSTAKKAGRTGTFKDCINLLPKIAEMGFDILYFPPIHPIGTTHRKGKNNNPAAQKGEPGSPWAIGSSEGGHDAIHKDLGTIEDYKKLILAANSQGIEIAFDLAFQCSPDHP